MTDYIGKTCPYCKCTIQEGDDIVVCSACEMPHHRDCWVENQGCTTFGCQGTIQGVGAGPTSVTSGAMTYEDGPRKVYCTRCGTACAVGTNFCIGCGNRMTQPPVQPNPYVQQPQYRQPQYPQYGQPQMAPPNPYARPAAQYQPPQYQQPQYQQPQMAPPNPYARPAAQFQQPQYQQPQYQQPQMAPPNPYARPAAQYRQPQYNPYTQQPQYPQYPQPQYPQPQAAPNPYLYQSRAAQPQYQPPVPQGQTAGDDKD